jgi:LPS-assembly protein
MTERSPNSKNFSSIGPVLGLMVSAVFIGGAAAPLLAQERSVEAPNRRYLFTEDSRLSRRQAQREKKDVLSADKPVDSDVDFKAPTVEFLQESSQIKGSGGVVISGRGVQAQADEATFNTASKEAALSGSVRFATPQGSIGAAAAAVNLESETGTFSEADFYLEEGNYGVQASEAKKLSETEFELLGCQLSTCACEDPETKPWSIRARRGHITAEGYAHTYDATLRIYDVPVLYTPYLVFPVKQERASGLLAGQYGFGSDDGLAIRQPIFGVIDDHTDITVTPFVETRTRFGGALDVRKAFSRYNYAEGRFLYSNESMRDGSLRGTDLAGLADPPVNSAGEFDEEDRFGGYFSQLWRSSPTAPLSSSFLADVHYVSDDLLLRELDEPDIGSREDRYTTSTLAARIAPLDFMSAEARGEFNQALRNDDDDEILQRLPELSVGALKSFRPFGFNPYGLKVTGRMDVLSTDFVRRDGYDGWRTDIRPSLTVPFHVANYFNSSMTVGMRNTIYNLDERLSTDGSLELDANQDRQVFDLRYAVGTSVERVYELEKGNWLSRITTGGLESAGRELVRLKHTVEPGVSFTFVPDTSQEDLPLFDSLDRIRERSLFIYGFTTRLYGRFDSPLASVGAIPELAPELGDLATSEEPLALGGIGGATLSPFSTATVSPRRSGDIREIANFTLRQGYDYKEDVEDNDPDREGFTDVNARVGLFPSSYFGFIFDTNYGVENGDLSSWAVQNHLRGDRGDALRFRYSFVDDREGTDELSQLDGQLELKVSDRLKLGYYARYDEAEREFIDSSVGVRILSSCNCWHLDVGYTERLNPEKEQVFMRFTFAGLGDITQDIGMGSGNQRGR